MSYRELPRAQNTIQIMFPPQHVYAGTWAANVSSLVSGGVYASNSSAAQNDSAGFDIDITEGTWSLAVTYNKNINGGIITFDISFDGGATWVAITGTADGYAASSQWALYTATGIVVPQGTTKAILRTKSSTKNGLSSGYAMVIDQIGILRTA